VKPKRKKELGKQPTSSALPPYFHSRRSPNVDLSLPEATLVLLRGRTPKFPQFTLNFLLNGVDRFWRDPRPQATFRSGQISPIHYILPLTYMNRGRQGVILGSLFRKEIRDAVCPKVSGNYTLNLFWP
jgi:hypothetical protein